ncbi:hypothetical protein GWO43_19680, partial [candidate division KSB1 bacterium]|nr:hypothetical protein [candidate division KSB1 bacterium]NIR71398.1 hypothetical protein [candidate division KSB1 bacterium]NIS26292.1 hypothetical protein [candidate division KSB1 bacterium]NIT73055.1 hypothetical protein [candidate division KSB1 bacterium]NIU26962.1 hypothetical protein [candidate division KSB1 bacterium]
MQKVKKSFFVITIFAFLQNLFPATGSLPTTESRTFTERIASDPGKTLYIDDTQAELVISGHNENEIVAEAVVEISEAPHDLIQEFFAETRLRLEPYRDGVRLRLRSPR